MRIEYPEHLPVSARRQEIADAIRANQVVIVAGETGSGKTTQLPKICLELGRGADAGIGHTQPRRIAARSVAERIAEELGSELGGLVGYQVRFTDRSSKATRVKVMTDGILLAEIQRDRELKRYDTIIIDEAHERSLNIDFLLGYLRQLLPRRPDLKLIITSATIDPEKFSRHFSDAPIIEVSGRTYPVEVRYRELDDDQTQGIVDAVDELVREGPGDILVFLSGEREIRDAAEALGKVKPRRPTDAFEVFPLYARLSAAEQHRVFASHSTRRVVLATNVAETSLTVPGVRYVVDTGLARISRFSARTKVQRLPIEPISKASADQRKGRCGRVADGVCIRLYAEDDFEARPDFTDPEILRTNLASVILQMATLDLGEVAAFPFVDPPDVRSVQAGVQLLEELGALTTKPTRSQQRRTRGRDRSSSRDGRPRLTPVGRQLAQLPIDPRLARMVLEAVKHECVRDVVTICAALSIQDPRERPLEQQQAADGKHARFADNTSDFAGILNLWRYIRTQQRELSSSAFRRLCKADFLNYLRIREWQDLDSQLRQACKQIDVKVGKPRGDAGDDTVDMTAIHQSLLAGLLSHIGMRDPDKRDYLGARGTRFAIFPGSALFKKQPQFVMAAELVETGRLWARTNAGIDPEWAEAAGAHLIKRSYSEPHWEQRRGAVIALEKVTLYGVPIVADRKVNYGRIDKEASREIFIRHALVQGEWRTHHAFFAANQRLLDEAEDFENRARRRDIVVDDETLFDFYDRRIGRDVVSVAHFDSWWKEQRRTSPTLLDFSLDMLVNDTANDFDAEDFPDRWRHGDSVLELAYEFEPGSAADGVTVAIPVTTLNQVDAEDFSWPVPGLREELVVALLRSLPKQLRVKVVPAPNHARSFLAQVAPGEEPLLTALERYIRRSAGIVVDRSDWDLGKVPPHLRLSFEVVSDAGDVLAAGKDLEALKRQLHTRTGDAIGDAGATLARDGLLGWDFDELPRVFKQTRAGHEVTGYPALVDRETSVSIRVLASERQQEAAMRLGVRRLLMLAVASPAKAIADSLDNPDKLALGLNPHGGVAALLDDCYAAAVDELVAGNGGPCWDRSCFDQLRAVVAEQGRRTTEHVMALAREALRAAYDIDKRLSGRADIALLPALTDLKAQWARLIHPGFAAAAGAANLRSYPRYFKAMGERLDKLPGDPRRDAVAMGTIAPLQSAYADQLSALPPDVPAGAELDEIRWLLEDLRVSLWAQQLGTTRPVSPQRIARALSELG